MTKTPMDVEEAKTDDLFAAARHWDELAHIYETTAKWDRARGIDLSVPGQSPGDKKAEIIRRLARTLRAEALTGVPYCMCHEKPKYDCPWSNG